MAEVQIKGWCPTALRPMQSGDGMIVRIRPRMARLTPQQARGLAAASAKYGNGLIDLSARGNIQLRGIRTGTHHALLADLDALHLIDPHESPEFHRAILVTPFWQPEDGTDAPPQILGDLLDRHMRLGMRAAPLIKLAFGRGRVGTEAGLELRLNSARFF